MEPPVGSRKGGGGVSGSQAAHGSPTSMLIRLYEPATKVRRKVHYKRIRPA